MPYPLVPTGPRFNARASSTPFVQVVGPVRAMQNFLAGHEKLSPHLAFILGIPEAGVMAFHFTR